MLRSGIEAGTEHGADHQWCFSLATEHVAELGGLIENLVEANTEKVDEHQLGDRPQSRHRGASRHAHDSAFGDRGIDYTMTAELADQAARYTHDASIGIIAAAAASTAGHIFSNNDDTSVATHLGPQRVVERLTIGNLRHERTPSVASVDITN